MGHVFRRNDVEINFADGDTFGGGAADEDLVGDVEMIAESNCSTTS